MREGWVCGMTISEAFELYKLDFIAFKNQSAKTEEMHYVAMRSLIDFTGDIQIESLTYEHIRNWKLYLDKARSASTTRGYIIKLRVVLKFLLKRGYRVLDPDAVPVPQRRDTVPDVLTREDVAKLINTTRRLKNKAIVSFLYASGVRVGELCSLDRSQLRDNRFTVVGKGGRARLCFIDERTRTLLDLYLQERTDNHPALFLTDMGTRITPGTVQETFKSLRTTSGIKCHPHTLRHTFCTELLLSNTNLRYAQMLMGHKSLATTQQYLHVADHDLEEIYRLHHKV